MAMQRTYTHILLCGDFNYREIDWENEFSNPNSHYADFINTIQEHFLFQHVREPTRYRGEEEPSVLDLIFTNEEGMVNNLVSGPGLGESDHTVLMFELCCYRHEHKVMFHL